MDFLYKRLLAGVLICIPSFLFCQETTIESLSGTDKDHTVPWDFLCTRGSNSGVWGRIPVPSNWELQGFGTYNYHRDVKNPGEQGLYRYHFATRPAWKNKKVS